MPSIQADTDRGLIQQLEREIRNILSKDELLSDVPSYATVEELEALLAIEKGQAYNISIERQPLPSIDITVWQSSTVRDIKRMIRLHVNRQPLRKQISWRCIWMSHCLEFEGTKLLNEDTAVSQLGIKQHSVLKFARLPYEKGQHRKAWRRRP
ncbi:u11/U12 small nuclear ribonucleoprotein 25 kDa protein-like [Mucor ambiguus]|uniref:U11/U12 small nuclear ribonucleoprotein 25 kDa protein-like n=1 Tax=Mucor ambiguus TaxID=91626 RepID=A0A0C9M933_9FUNG|nr:u11/U12 small nuclear ribonucleoprotein 25 kDa protein-like [Mucor ambiguus]